MSSNFVPVKNCKLCRSKNLKKVLGLPKLPIGDKYLPKDQAQMTKEVLNLTL